MHARKTLTTLCALALAATGACKSMNPFAADLGRTELDGKAVRPPYMSLASYFGHVGEDVGPEYGIYVWLPTSTPELGVRFLSSVNGYARPDASRDVVEDAYTKNKADKAFFDPSIKVERCLTALATTDVTKPCAQWVSLGENDDSQEMPANPNGIHTNSLIRVGAHVDDPLKAIVRGLYRVTFSAAKGTRAQGNFVMQLGAPVMLDHVAMARSPEVLAERLATLAPNLPEVPVIGHTGASPARAEPKADPEAN